MSEFFDNFEIDGYEDALNQNVDVEEIETATPYLCVVAIDSSGSMCDYDDDNSGIMNDCLKNFKSSILNSKQADEMLISKITFDNDVDIGGFVKPEDFDCSYSTRGCTALNDSIVAARKLIVDYMEDIRESGGTPRGCLVILSDGYDNNSKASDSDARRAIQELQKQEVAVAFITFGSGAAGVASNLGINPKNIKDFNNDEHGLREALNMVSKSAISASKRASAGLGNGDDAGYFDV